MLKRHVASSLTLAQRASSTLPVLQISTDYLAHSVKIRTMLSAGLLRAGDHARSRGSRGTCIFSDLGS